jgi:hypothetical protein
MKLKREQYRCNSCDISVLLAHPTCHKCGRQMDSKNDSSFMRYVTIHKLREHENYEDFYVFNLSIGPISIRGLTYNPESRSIRWPKCSMNGYKAQPIQSFGTFINDLRTKLDAEIANLRGHDEEFGADEDDSVQLQAA